MVVNKYISYIVGAVLFSSCTLQENVIENENAQLHFSPKGSLSEIVLKCDGNRSLIQTEQLKDSLILTSNGQNSYWGLSDSYKKGKSYIQRYEEKNGAVNLEWLPVSERTFKVHVSYIPKLALDSAAITLSLFDLNPKDILEIYCLPQSLPFIRVDSLNKIPEGYISKRDVFSNIFSLITDRYTCSMAVLPPAERQLLTKENVQPDYFDVGFKPDKLHPEILDGSMTVRLLYKDNLKANVSYDRTVLLSFDANEGGYVTGYHIGDYMRNNEVEKKDNLMTIYQKSMCYLLHNPFNFSDKLHNYYGSITSNTGVGYANGNALYAMYGNSFSVAALNQYRMINPETRDVLDKRLNGVNDFLLKSDVLGSDSLYWSMLDLGNNAGYVDQAYRKWKETHATGWITFYLLSAYEISGNEDYLSVAKRTLQKLASLQKVDGSIPKYFEDGKASSDNVGDLGWSMLSFMKAVELGVKIPNCDLELCIKKGCDWMINNLLAKKSFYGSFEDVGGVNDAYCSSVSALAWIKAYKLTKDERYLQASKDALSVSLIWLTTDDAHTTYKPSDAWGEQYELCPTYAHVESTSCYFPCSYTLAMLYLAASEVALNALDMTDKAYWSDISNNLNHCSTFLLENADTKAKYGMEWLNCPFLVFTEWGNAQLCWAILETLRNKIEEFLPTFILDHTLFGKYKNESYSLYLPELDEQKGFVTVSNDVEPVLFKCSDGKIAMFIYNTKNVKDCVVKWKGAGEVIKGNKIKLRDIVSGEVISDLDREVLAGEGIKLDINGFRFILFDL